MGKLLSEVTNEKRTRFCEVISWSKTFDCSALVHYAQGAEVTDLYMEAQLQENTEAAH